MSACFCIYGAHDPRCCIHRSAASTRPNLMPKLPHTCPICFGQGTVRPGFYLPNGINLNKERERCKGCNGNGVIIA